MSALRARCTSLEGTTRAYGVAPPTFVRDEPHDDTPAARRHARPAPPQPRATVSLRAGAVRCCAAVSGSHSASQCFRGPLPRAHTGLKSQQVHIDPGAATGQDTAEGTKAAIAAAAEQTGAEGRVPEGRHNQAQEAQLWRAQDCQGASEHREGHHRLHSR